MSRVYISMARGSPCVVPSYDLIVSPLIIRSVLSQNVLIRALAKLDIATEHSWEWTVDLGAIESVGCINQQHTFCICLAENTCTAALHPASWPAHSCKYIKLPEQSSYKLAWGSPKCVSTHKSQFQMDQALQWFIEVIYEWITIESIK